MIKAIRKFWERGKKGYCYEDMWSFDYWLSDLIARGLREFRDNCHSYPNDIDEFAEWLKILDEMIECFEEQSRGINNISGDLLFKSSIREMNKRAKLHRGFELLEKYYYDLWD